MTEHDYWAVDIRPRANVGVEIVEDESFHICQRLKWFLLNVFGV